MDSQLKTDNAENMDELYKFAKAKFTSNMFAEFGEIREAELVSDFEIRVENETFSVHRFILIAASKYFKAMFMSNMKETEQKYVDMKGVNAEGVKYCLQFIYTREIDLVKSPVEFILQASHLMQIDDLTNLCFGYLRLNISTDSCISTLKTSQFYNRNDVKNIADQYILDHWEEVETTDDFLLLNMEDLICYLEKLKADYISSWKAVVRWLEDKNENREQLLLRLMELMQIEKFPSKFLLETVLNDSLILRHQKAYGEVMNLLLSNPGQLKQSLTLETVFSLRKFAKTNMVGNEEDVLKVLNEYIANNIEHLAYNEEIADFEKKEIVNLFVSNNAYFAERAKFIAAVKWTKRDHRNRITTFTKLLKLIKLVRLSSDFIQQNIPSDFVVKESPECLNHILEHLSRDPTAVPHIACLYTETKEIKVFNLSNNQWCHLVKVPKSGYMSIVSVGNVLYLLNNDDLLVLQGDGTWLRKGKIPLRPQRLVSFQNCIFGIDNGTTSYYDPRQNIWNTNLPGCQLISGFSVAASDKFIYAMGGWETWNSAKKFDPKTRTWSEIPSMKNGRLNASSAVLDGKVFAMGGYNFKRLDEIEFFSQDTQKWTTIASMCCFRSTFGSCVVNNKLYVVGGAHDANNKLLDPDSIEVFNQKSGKWKIVHEMTNTNGWVTCCAIHLK